MTATTTTVKAAAIAAYKAGLSVMPVREDGSKSPAVSAWAHLREERASKSQMRAWFNIERAGLILVCGYDDIETLDFDSRTVYQTFCDTAEAAGMGELLDRIRSGYEEWTPAGVHLIYRCATNGVEKLAYDASGEAIIETKGMGGYVVIAPSHGAVHDTGEPYVLKQGGFDTIARITPEERDALFALARAFDERPKVEWETHKTAHNPSDSRPGDEFNARGPAWSEILNGWTLVYRRGQTEYWRRPGKDRGISASINGPGVGSDRLYVFTSSTAFDADRSYSKFQAYAVIEHDGDFSAAAASLARRGYGGERDGPRLIFTNGQRSEPLTGTERRDYPLTDTGNAERLVDEFGDRIRYVTAHERWLVYDGKRWAPDETRQLERMAKETARKIHAESLDIDDKKMAAIVATWSRRSESTAGKRNMIVSAQAEPGIVLNHNDLDAQPHYLNTYSGTVDLRTGYVRPFRKQDYLSKITKGAYDSRAAYPTWAAFLERIFNGDADLINYIQRAVGYSFTGSTKEQVLFILYGDGSNGKSTFLNTIRNIASDYARTTAAETLYERRGDAIPNDLAALQGTRLVSAFETEDRRALSEGRVKQMTGGDQIAARFMRAEWFEFTPQFKVWFVTNHKPEIKGTDHAIWRRMRLVPFTVTIGPDEVDPEMPAKLKQEAAGILRWIVDGAKAWYEHGLEPTPEVVLGATAEYRNESDYIGMWVGMRCQIHPEAHENTTVLYQDFVSWSQKMGRDPISLTRFGTELNAAGQFPKEKSGGVVIRRGLQLKDGPTLRFGND